MGSWYHVMPEDTDILASRAVEPAFYRAPAPDCVTPSEYQLAAAEYALSRDHCLIADAPGLGKTAECILVGNAIEAERTLVVCPASLRLNWEREIWRWSTLENVSTYPVLKGADGISPEADYVIISYSLLAKPALLAAVLDLHWDHLILDEAHAMKDPKGNTRTKSICGWYDAIQDEAHPGAADVADRITMATGTPTPNQPIEMYNTLRLLDWAAIEEMSLDAFRNHYYDEGGGMVRSPVPVTLPSGEVVMRSEVHWSQSVRNVPRNLDELQYRLRKNIMVRRLKQQVLHELPAKRWHMVPLETTPGLRKATRSMAWRQVEHLYEMDPEHFDAHVPIDGAVSTARRELGEAKVPGALAYIRDLADGGTHKIIVGAWHKSVVERLVEGLRKEYGTKAVVSMQGATSARRRQEAVDDFQDHDEVRFIVGQTAVMGEGWTLTASQDVVNVEPDWVPGRNDQLVDRAHRRGQVNSVIGHVLVAPDSLDERIVARVIEKDTSIHATLD